MLDPALPRRNRHYHVQFAVAGSQSKNETISVLGGRAALAIGLLLVLLSSLPIEAHPAKWLVLPAGCWAAVVGIWFMAVPRHVPLPVMDALLLIADALLVLLAHYDASVQPALPGVYLIIGCILFAVRSWPVIVVHVSLLATSYALALYVGTGQAAPVGRWIAVMTISVTVGLYIRWLVATVSGLAAHERVARGLAETATRDLERESRVKTVFLARMSHELRTPLNVVLGFAELLREQLSGPLNDRQLEYVSDIGDSARHLVTLVDDVLDLADVEAGEVRLNYERVDVCAAISESLAMLRDRANAKGLTVTARLPSSLLLPAADRVKLRQVFVNLIANAVTFTPPGGHITVRAWLANRNVQIAVEDTGVGVAADDRERIFEEYGQAHSTSGGTGLGLPLARRFVELHGGRLWLLPRAEGGSVFRVELPQDAPAVDEAGLPLESGSDADYSAFTEPGGPANRALMGRLSLRLWIAGSLLVGMLGLVTPEWTLPSRLIAIGVGVVVPPFTLAFSSHLGNLSQRQVVISTYVFIVGVCALTYVVRPYHQFVPLGFAWITMIIFSLGPSRRAIVQLCAIGVGYAVTLAVLSPTNPVGRWLALMVLLSFTAEIISWMGARLRELVVAEQLAHREARTVQAELTATSRHKSMFVANMSHELRTPLNAVIGFSELLATELPGSLNGRQREYLRDVQIAARQLLAIINDVLDAAKIEAGQFGLDLDVVGVLDLLERAVEIGDPPRQSRLARVDIEVGAGADYVIGDRQRLEQVLVQLVTNGAKFTPSGGRVRLEARTTDESELHISVSDSGIGIVASQIPRIFDAFHQGTRLPVEHVPGGTGLGLTLAKSIVEMHGGRIWVTSVPDQGSTFTIALPAMASAGRLVPAGARGAS